MINAPHVALSSINPPYIFHNNHVSKECQLQLQVATFQDLLQSTLGINKCTKHHSDNDFTISFNQLCLEQF
jgi:hypothetical protein